jgi:hypothetical protein
MSANVTITPSQCADHDLTDDDARVQGWHDFLGVGRLRAADVAISSLAFLLCVAYVPSLFFLPGYTPRLALLVLVLPAGAVAVVRLARSGDRAAVAACAVVTWIVAAALLAPAPRLALVGSLGNEASGFIVVCTFAVWGLGRLVSDTGRICVARAVLLGIAVSGAVAIVQVLVDASAGPLAMRDGRANGLTPNAVYLGASAVCAFVLASDGRTLNRRLAHVATVGFAFVAGLSGSRIAALVLLAFAVGAAVRRRTRETGQSLLAALVGLSASWLVMHVLGSAGDGSAAARATTAGGGGRLEAWGYGVRAALERPVAGWGFGRFHSAVQSRFNASFSSEFAFRDTRFTWFDAHNVVVGVAVAAGLVGLALVAAFGWFAGRRSQAPLASGVAALAAVWLVQPAGLATLPLGMLLLGAAHQPHVRVAPHVVRRRSLSAVIVLGAVPAVWLLAADVGMQRALDAAEPRALVEAAGWLPPDPVLADAIAQAWQLGETRHAHVQAVEWAERAVELDPASPFWWARLGALHLRAGELESADAALASALELQPWHAESWRLRLYLADASGEAEAFEVATSRVCRLRLPECEPAREHTVIEHDR